MYAIIVYDVGQKRTSKMLKLCRRYFNWIQNSVFEGEITEARMREFKHTAMNLIERGEDSIIIFSNESNTWQNKEVLGIERSSLDQIL